MTTKMWAANEVKGMTLKDKRRQARVARILEAMVDNPNASIPQAHKGSEAATKGAYRLIGTTAMNEQDLLNGHYKTTIRKINNSPYAQSSNVII